MIEQDKRHWKYYLKQEILTEVGEHATAKEVLEHLFGDDEQISDYVVYKYEQSKRSLLNRINLLWVWPLYLVSIPFQWLITGKTGVNRNSKLGRIVDCLVKFD